MVTMWYPITKAVEVGKIGSEVMPKYLQPEIAKTRVMGVGTGKDGVEVVGIYEAQKGKFEEALNLAYGYVHEFYGVEGFSYEVKILRTAEEAFSMIGAETPDWARGL